MTGIGRLAFAACMSVALLLTNQPARSQPAADPLVGIWGSQTSYAPALRGELSVTRDGPDWQAKLAGAVTQSAVSGDQVRITFPGDLGEFRGALTNDGSAIDGFWLQSKDPRDPGGSGQPFASPLVLKRSGANVWRGAVRPLEGSFTLYLRIFPKEDGTLIGAFRNPEMNSHGSASQFHVTRAGDAVQFSARPDPAQPEIRLTATFKQSPDQLEISWPDLGHVVDLARLTPSQAANFFPRPPGEKPYTYQQPPTTGDGWETARARDVGMDEAVLAQLVQRLSDADPSIGRPQIIHSLLVARHGKLVLEEYFFGFDRDQVHDLRSAGKTFASVMLGATMRQGVNLKPETPVYGLLAGMGPFANPDPRKAQITLAQLMTHTSGLACDDNDDASRGNEDTMQTQSLQPNWWKYTLDLPMTHDPGSRYAYCSAGMNLVGAALTTATNTWLPELFDRTVARPLQFGQYYWNLMPTEEGYQGGGAYVRPRDLLKVGQAYLDGGVWHGTRIVDASWVSLSTAPHMEINEATTGLDANQFPNFYGKGADGYAWHLNNIVAGEHTYREYGASGNGGQLLIVLPELDMTVVFTAGNYLQGGIWSRFQSQIVPREIIPAIQR
jgi:CubicO group peptidase (beta-lactamase class C family)